MRKNEEKQQNSRYLQQYLRRLRGWERLFAGLTLLGVAALLGCQLWLWQSSSRADAWYGLDYAEVQPAAVLPAMQEAEGLWGSVTLELQKYTQLERAYVLINGVRAGAFAENSLTLRVCDGDLLELDCTAYSRPVGFRLTKSSAGIDRALLQTELRLQGERALIGRIEFK